MSWRYWGNPRTGVRISRLLDGTLDIPNEIGLLSVGLSLLAQVDSVPLSFSKCVEVGKIVDAVKSCHSEAGVLEVKSFLKLSYVELSNKRVQDLLLILLCRQTIACCPVGTGG
jgi:hypothetical protein